MNSLHTIELLAGYDSAGKPVVERMQVKVMPEGKLQLVRSPAFVRGLAAGDIIKLAEGQQFEILQRSGNLTIAVYSRGDVRSLSEALTPELEKMGGSLDIETPRMLVYSVHVSLGFQAIEALLNKHMKAAAGAAVWRYGNVYDPADGETPLNWWLDILKPQ